MFDLFVHAQQRLLERDGDLSVEVVADTLKTSMLLLLYSEYEVAADHVWNLFTLAL